MRRRYGSAGGSAKTRWRDGVIARSIRWSGPRCVTGSEAGGSTAQRLPPHTPGDQPPPENTNAAPISPPGPNTWAPPRARRLA